MEDSNPSLGFDSCIFHSNVLANDYNATTRKTLTYLEASQHQFSLPYPNLKQTHLTRGSLQHRSMSNTALAILLASRQNHCTFGISLWTKKGLHAFGVIRILIIIIIIIITSPPASQAFAAVVQLPTWQQHTAKWPPALYQPATISPAQARSRHCDGNYPTCPNLSVYQPSFSPHMP